MIRPHHHNLSFGAHLSNEPLALETVAAGLDDCDLRLHDMHWDKQSLSDVIHDFHPNVVGTSGYTADVNNMKKVLSEAKQLDPTIFTVVGGHHVTLGPNDFNAPFVDAVAIGQGEETFNELVEQLASKKDIRDIPGLALPNNDELYFTHKRPLDKNLDALPLPRRDLVAKYQKHYRVMGKRVALINTAKGCPFKCRFCSIVQAMQGAYLTKSPGRVLEELGTIKQKTIRFADGNTFGNIKRIKLLSDMIQHAGLKKEFIMDIRSDTVIKQAKLIEKWREVGLKCVAIGLEATKDSRLSKWGKNCTVEQNDQAIEILHKNDIQIIGQFMIDYDFALEDFVELADYVDSRRIAFPSYLILTPFPGTPIHEENSKQFSQSDFDQFDCFHPLLDTKLPQKEFLRHFIELYRKSYGISRVAKSLARRFTSVAKHKDAPLSLLLVSWLFLSFMRRRIERDYGLR